MDSFYTHCPLHVTFIISFEHHGFFPLRVIFVLLLLLLKYHTQLTHNCSPLVLLCPLSISTKRSQNHFREVVVSISGRIFKQHIFQSICFTHTSHPRQRHKSNIDGGIILMPSSTDPLLTQYSKTAVIVRVLNINIRIKSCEYSCCGE